MSSKAGGRKKKSNLNIITDNRKSRFLYNIEETFEAGIVLEGSEIKSLRMNRINIKESYASQEKGEIFLINANIPKYKNAFGSNHKPKRKRKLLLNKKEIIKISSSIQRKGMTVVPTRMYFNNNGIAKIELGVGKGRKLYDKREVKKTRDWERQKSRLLKDKN
ncbi:MAG: SsrA-binding protein SmpB [Pseudomonadota bacterium]|nr:SsrA-binding protein SmpB [Pseudomonadota bacterium]MEE3295347.1 SsrA-binding protein SmpB [Pseudomonadota bacterium]